MYLMCVCKKKNQGFFLNKSIHLLSTTYIVILIFLTTLIFTNYVWDVKKNGNT